MKDMFDIESLRAQKDAAQRREQQIAQDKQLAIEKNKNLIFEYYKALSKAGVKPDFIHSRYGKMYDFGWNDGEGHGERYFVSSTGNCYKPSTDYSVADFKKHIKSSLKAGKIDEGYSISWKSYKGIIDKENDFQKGWRIFYIAEEVYPSYDVTDILEKCFAEHVKELL